MKARLENGGSIEKWRLDWKIEARLRNRASFVAEWQNEVSWSFQIESFWSGLPETLSDPTIAYVSNRDLMTRNVNHTIFPTFY